MTGETSAASCVDAPSETGWRSRLQPVPGTEDLNLEIYTKESLLDAASMLRNAPTRDVLSFFNAMSAGQRKSESRETILGVMSRDLDVDENTLERWRRQSLERESGDTVRGLLQAARQGIEGVKGRMNYPFILQDRVYMSHRRGEEEVFSSMTISHGCKRLDDLVDDCIVDRVLTDDQNQFVREVVKLAIEKTHSEIKAHQWALDLIEREEDE